MLLWRLITGVLSSAEGSFCRKSVGWPKRRAVYSPETDLVISMIIVYRRVKKVVARRTELNIGQKSIEDAIQGRRKKCCRTDEIMANFHSSEDVLDGA